MEWKEVSAEEYEEEFKRIRDLIGKKEYEEAFKCIRDLIGKIEHDPRLGWEGFEIKQELREVVRTLLKTEIKQELREVVRTLLKIEERLCRKGS